MKKIDTTKYAEELIQETKILQDKEMSKICTNWKDKVLLVLKSELYYPYIRDEINANIQIYSKYKYFESQKIEVITPYPNKNVFKIVSIKGRKVCKEGVVFVFDNIEELKKINSLKITWTVKHPEQNEKKILASALTRVVVNYKLSFDDIDENNKVFSIYTNDFPLNYLFSAKCEDKLRDTIFEEYDKIIQTKSNMLETKSVYLKGEPSSFDSKGTESFFINEVAFREDELDNIFNKNGITSLYYYEAREKLSPRDYALF